MAGPPARLGFTSYRQSNNLKSTLLILAFPLLLAALLGVIFFVFGLVSIGGGSDPSVFADFNLEPVLGTGNAADLGLSAIYAWWPIVFGVAGVWVLIGYLFNGVIVRAATGAKTVTREQQPRLYNLLENLCISRGLKMPQLYIIDADALNAYASGIDERSYAITVTRGLLNALDERELEAVLAHELTHIMDRDCRLLIVTVVFTGMISFLAQMLWRSLRVASFGGQRSRKGGGGIVIVMLIAAVAFAIGYVLALMLRFAISRRREYMADAGSVDLTKNPDALISALRKISQNPALPNVPTEVRQMFIENPPRGLNLAGLFATHPPIEKRIQVLQALGGLPADLPEQQPPKPAKPAGGPWG